MADAVFAMLGYYYAIKYIQSVNARPKGRQKTKTKTKGTK